MSIKTKTSSAQAMYILSESYIVEDHASKLGVALGDLEDGNFEKNRRKMEIKVLNSAAGMKDPGTWASKELLDTLKFLNGKSLEQVPGLHFMVEEAQEQFKSKDFDTIALLIVDQEIRKACEAWLIDCNVSSDADEIIEAYFQEELSNEEE